MIIRNVAGNGVVREGVHGVRGMYAQGQAEFFQSTMALRWEIGIGVDGAPPPGETMQFVVDLPYPLMIDGVFGTLSWSNWIPDRPDVTDPCTANGSCSLVVSLLANSHPKLNDTLIEAKVAGIGRQAWNIPVLSQFKKPIPARSLVFQCYADLAGPQTISCGLVIAHGGVKRGT